MTLNAVTTPSSFLETDDCGAAPAPGSCTIHLIFSPTQSGFITGTVTLNNNTLFNNPYVINLSGIATAISVEPGIRTFPSEPLHSTSATSYVKLTNKGTNSVTMGTASATGDFKIVSNSCGSSLSGSASCEIGLQFTPTQTGSRTGTLTVMDSDPGSPQLILLSGTGVGATLAPANTAFTAEDDGTPAPTKSITLDNLTSSSMSITSAAISGANKADFKITNAGSCTSSLAATSSCNYVVEFTPTANGHESATLTVTDGQGTQTATLGGYGIAAALSPTVIVFPTTKHATASAPQTVTLYNYNSTPLKIKSASISGPFSIVSGGTCSTSTSVAKGHSCTYKVEFKPVKAGHFDGMLIVTETFGMQYTIFGGAGD